MRELTRGLFKLSVGWKWAAVALGLVACTNSAAQQSSNTGTAGTAGGSADCALGDTRGCLGPGACSGAQSCTASAVWSACVCGASGAGGIVAAGGEAGRDIGGGAGGGEGGGIAEDAGSNGGTTEAESGGAATQTSGSGGTAQTGGSGGTAQTGGSGGDSNCTPTVLLLVDASSSMFSAPAPLWPIMQSALLDPTSGVLAARQSQVRFGFTGYHSIGVPLDAPCPNLISVPYAIDNYNQINTAFSAIGASYTDAQKWGTPTGESISAAISALASYVSPTPGPKYILLLTDGNSSTCAVRDPQCGQDSSVAAAQHAFSLGIRLLTVGVGDVSGDSSGCVGRCGVEHLQDMANAGSGQPVAANTSQYALQECVGGAQNLKALYAEPGAPGGAAPYYTAQTSDQLRAALNAIVNAIATCQ